MTATQPTNKINGVDVVKHMQRIGKVKPAVNQPPERIDNYLGASYVREDLIESR